jgi:hypothetical protein
MYIDIDHVYYLFIRKTQETKKDKNKNSQNHMYIDID